MRQAVAYGVRMLGAAHASLRPRSRSSKNGAFLATLGCFDARRTEQLLSLTADEILPAGALEYGMSVGECQFGRCAHTANIALRAGVASRLSARVGVEGEVDSSRHVIARDDGHNLQ